MCDPTTIAIMGIASTAMSAYGSYQQAKAQEQQAEYQAAVSRNNQIIANRQAEDVRKLGKDEANRYRRDVDLKAAEQMVGLAGQGVDVTDGTSIDLLADTKELGEQDATMIEANAEREAYKYEVQGMNFGAQSNLYKSQASNANPMFAGVSSLLSGGTTVASRWHTMNA